MRTTDPIDFLNRHRDTIFKVLGLLAVLLVLFLIIRAVAMRLGGWGAAWARVKRECAVTAHAFAAPVKAWLRHRRSLRVLVHGLRAPETWRDAELALAAARHATRDSRSRPYAVLVTDRTVTVLLTGLGEEPPEDGPWWVAEGDTPDHWSAERAELPPVVPVPDLAPPVLVAVGAAEGGCCLLDLGSGPPVVCVEGESRAAVALHQALAAQVEVRLPQGMVVIAEGVHRGYEGMPTRAAHRAADRLKPRAGIAPVLIAAELPDPLPPELTAPPSDFPELRLLLLGEGRAYLRIVLTDRTGQVRVVGTPLLAEGNALSRAIAKVLTDIPPVLPREPAGETDSTARTFAELDEEAVDEEGDTLPSTPTAPGLTAPPVAETEEEDEAEAAPVPAPEAPDTPLPSARPVRS
ncbi:hypothetical protein SAMN06297387_11421 [Streptomyces zhaozhouensis]|uniref:Uncharacterized protein n=1 Tax=Streptomyces zhaozhouensis TaxID=1300267 RepID=A0A286DZE4_9ACTN|nr:hypothetical protein [Streptomyces zhaozhouensis]SOD64042.1 hypothetical protein SAMN06297387_11421 [Streptomyces zhaozhouensis]